MRELGTPVMDKIFFRHINAQFKDRIKIFLVKKQNRPVSASIAVFFKGKAEAPWIASLKRYFADCPNNFIYWEMLKYARQNENGIFDFGRSTRGSGHAVFKERWGALPVDLCWQYYLRNLNELPALNPDNPKFFLAINIWKRLPVFITNLVGPHIARNLP
jgi:hypothetical protein